MAEVGVQEALTLIQLPPGIIADVLTARANHEAGERRTRLLDLATAFHPGEKGRALLKLSKQLEKASKPPRQKLTPEEEMQAALAALVG